jgi:ACS family tartrate transporter-like MFS transporter
MTWFPSHRPLADARDPLERPTMRKVILRIMPFTVFVFVVAFVDRANVSFAALQMRQDLALTSQTFGFAAGIFFVGYSLLEVPSNIALRRYGSRLWLSRIQITWGLVACASAFVQSAEQFYAARFLLGVAEAGLIPGLIAYYNYWFPMRYLARMGALLGAGVPIAYIISGPLSTHLMEYVSLFGLSGWRSMFFIEGLPALATGGLTLWLLTNRPAEATWLKREEREWLVRETRELEDPDRQLARKSVVEVLISPTVIYIALISFLYHFGEAGIDFWLPQLLKARGNGLTNLQVGWISSIPYVVALIGLYFWSWSSDYFNERRVHTALALLLAGFGLAATLLHENVWIAVILFSFSLTGFFSVKAPFSVIPRLFLTRESAVIAFAYIGSIGNLGNGAGPYAFGLLMGETNDAKLSVLVLAGVTVFAGLMMLRLTLRSPVAAPGPDVAPARAAVDRAQ